MMTKFAVVGLLGMAGHWDFESILFAAVAPCWLAGAIGLFFGHRLAWCGCLLGAGTMFCNSLTMFASGIVLSPVAQDPTDGIGYSLVLGLFGLLFSLVAIVGLFWSRKDLFGNRSGIPNKSPEPTRVGAVSSAVEVQTTSRRWLRFLR
jgi:hypothetical protein